MLNLTELIGFGAGGGDAHSYWRIVILAAGGGVSSVGIGEIEMRGVPGGADQCNGGSCGASSVYDVNSCTYAFDNLVGDSNGWEPNINNGIGEYIWYQFPSPVSVKELYLYSRRGSLNGWPTQIRLDWSDDGTNWTPQSTVNTGFTGTNQVVILGV